MQRPTLMLRRWARCGLRRSLSSTTATTESSAPLPYPTGRILFVAPFSGLEHEMQPAALRQSLHNFANHSGLCYALLAGIAAGALFGSASGEDDATAAQGRESASAPAKDKTLHGRLLSLLSPQSAQLWSQGLFASALFW
jgi:hypothetical protein